MLDVENDSTVGEVLKLMEADNTVEAKAPDQPTPDSADTPSRAGQETTEPVPTPDSDSPTKADAPAAADPISPDKKPSDQKPAERDDKGRFAKDQARRNDSWKALNDEKAAFRKEQEAFKAQTERLVHDRKRFEEQVAAAQKPSVTPEQAEEQGRIYQRQAEEAEAKGEYDAADELKVQAKQMKKFADHLRANPPATIKTSEQLDAEFAEGQKQWWGKAVVDFPAVANQASPEAKALKALVESNPATFEKYPDAMYWGARLVCAETAAASAAAKDKELGALRAKVKELTEKSAIPSDAAATSPRGPVPFEQKSEDEQEEELRQMAAAMS